MRTIAIVFGDNDFRIILVEFCKTLYRIHQENPITTKERVEDLLREGFYFHYVSFGRWYQEYKETNKEHLEFLRNTYFKGFKVLIDEEAEADISKKDHDGGAAYVLLESGQIESY